MEKKLPKNIRQIGNVSDNPKIYVEDYVDIYFEQLREKVNEGPVGAFLIGEILRQDEQEFVFVNGAVQIQDLSMDGKEIVLGDKSWKKGCEECKRHFEGKMILGWFLIAPELPMQLNYNLLRVHEKLFGKKSRLFVQKDIEEKEENYYMYKYNDLMHISGHYIYYEKNMDMQDYMIAKRRDNGVTPSEDYEDTATKSFRSTINKKEKVKSKQKPSFSYAVSGLIILAIIAVGVTYLNDYDSLKVVSTAITETISNGFGASEEDVVGKLDEMAELEVVVTDDSVVEEDYEWIEFDEATDEEEEEVETEEVESEEVPQGDEQVDADEQLLDVVSEDTTEVLETYIVQKDDTLVKISKAFYGDASRVNEICEINELDINDYIYAGQELLLP